jgi:hypothetical protein
LKPLLYIPFGVLRDTSPFSITKQPLQISTKACFIFFDDENFHYAVEYVKPRPEEGGLEGLAASAPWPQGQIAGAKKVAEEGELRKAQIEATG